MPNKNSSLGSHGITWCRIILTLTVFKQAHMQPVQLPRNNTVPETADGDEEGQATSQSKGGNLGMHLYDCLVLFLSLISMIVLR